MQPWGTQIYFSSELISLLLEALSCPDDVVQLSTLTCLEPLLLDAAEILRVHTDTFISKLLRLTSSPSMLLPLQATSDRALAKPLDDKKRSLVRKEAVEARCQWFLIGSPGS
ncbi:unnamed protein product [Ranitomeya imitator]|uniref:MMS19 nucleotide excision repair protein n=1 Tax=Ranitomeya imitator TaxID=111125 RepID=A0ABN9LAL9_9NEOB|nr:unnamed protein product [Ranitomeya imitator]